LPRLSQDSPAVHTTFASPHEVSLVTETPLESFVDDAIENDTRRAMSSSVSLLTAANNRFASSSAISVFLLRLSGKRSHREVFQTHFSALSLNLSSEKTPDYRKQPSLKRREALEWA
jgi:hypothetical protein